MFGFFYLLFLKKYDFFSPTPPPRVKSARARLSRVSRNCIIRLKNASKRCRDTHLHSFKNTIRTTEYDSRPFSRIVPNANYSGLPAQDHRSILNRNETRSERICRRIKKIFQRNDYLISLVVQYEFYLTASIFYCVIIVFWRPNDRVRSSEAHKNPNNILLPSTPRGFVFFIFVIS